jgi:pSer/pThr/pTyr-binding forkhead associated (FHA) protein
MDVALLLMRDGGQRRRFPLEHDVATVGRGEGCDLRIPLGDVSRKHCSLIKSDDGLVIQDIGSSNGTFVNGKRVQEASLRAGDQIRIGSLRFIVQIDGSPSEDDAHAFTTAAEQTAPETPADRAAEPSGSAAGPSGSRAPVPKAPVHSDADFIDMLDDDENFP